MASQDERKYSFTECDFGLWNLLPQDAFEAKTLAKCHDDLVI